VSTAEINSMTTIAEELRLRAFAQREREIASLPREALAEILALPEYTFALFQAIRSQTKSPAAAPLLDKLLQEGWITNRASFVPGECLIRPGSSSSVEMEVFRMERSALEEMKQVGLAPATLEWPLKNQAEADTSGFESLLLPAGQLRCRSLGIAWNAMAPFSRHTAVRITLTPANSDFEPLELTGAVFSSTGSRWSGYETIVSLHEASQEMFAAALYQHFGVPGPRRLELIALLSGVSWLSTCHRLAEKGLGARRQKVPIPPQTLRWIRLARQLERGPSSAARHLIRLVEGLLRRGLDGEVIALLDAAALLAQTVGADLIAAVGLGQRRLELHHREQVDERRLAQFYERPEQLRPFEDLMADPRRWALHYLGTAGVGKTMLMRFLNRRLLASKYAVARVDFDYLSADFPVRRPAQLLLELADGLQLHIRDTQTEGSFREFQNRVEYIHREVEGEPPPNDPLGNLHREEFHSVLSAFCDFLLRLPQPVVLFLDTCEELARLQPDGRFQPGVQATFEILERIQKRLEGSTASLRVIFAGRRLLAIRGAGWRSKGAALEERQRQFSTVDEAAAEPKEFLSLHEIRGFTETEAREYLLRRLSASRLEQKFTGDHPLVKAIIARSRDNTTACDFEWTDGHPIEEGDRFNPFNLSLYADWAIDDPRLTAEAIAEGGTDPYIEIRIIRRLRGEVLEVLPTLLLLRRMTKAWLADIFQFDGATTENLYRELCQIEWMDYQPRGEEGAWLEVDRNLRPRLERYYQGRERTGEIENARRSLERWIARALEQNRKPDTALLSAALRILPPEDAAEYWSQLERRIARDGDWHWALPVCQNLLPEEGTIGVPLQAAVNATLAAARLHTQKQPDVLRLWQMAEQTAGNNPIPEVAQWLADRAAAGTVAAKAKQGEEPSAEELSRFWQLVRERPSPNWGAAIEALTTLQRSRSKELLDFEAIRSWRHSAHFPQQVGGIAEAMLPTPNGQLIENEVNLAVQVQPGQALDRVSMPDWPLPARLDERLRLELLAIGSENVRDASLLHRWRDEAMLHLDFPDSAWLVARIIEMTPPTERGELSELTDRLRDIPYTPLTTSTQQHTLPMFVALANAWNDVGDPEQALALLDRPLEAATLDPIATVQAQRSKARILRQHKMVERAQLFLNNLRLSQGESDSTTVELLEETVSPSVVASRKISWTGIIGLIVGLALLVAVIVLLFKLFAWGYSFWLPSVRSGWRFSSFALALFALITGSVFLPRLSRRMTRGWKRLSDAGTIASLAMARPDTTLGDSPTEIIVRLREVRLPRGMEQRLRIFFRFYGALFRVFVSTTARRNWLSTARAIMFPEWFEAEATWMAQRREMRPHLISTSAEGDAVLQELRRLLDSRAPQQFFLGINCLLPASDLPWEEAITGLLAGKEKAPPINFAPFRTDAVLGKEFPRRWRAADQQTLRTLMTTSWERPIRQAWTNGANRSLVYKLFGRFVTKGPARPEGPANFRICHLLGETVRRRNSVRFRASPTALGSIGETVEAPTDSEEKIRSAEQLLLEEKGLFILQEIPETSGDRLQTDRERTADMRRFANELFQGGAWAVLLIPNLPSALALRIIECLGSGLSLLRPPSWGSLLQLTSTIRREIAKASALGTPEFLFELAWEVTLFARSEAHASLVEKNQNNRPAASSEPA
jgi:hypothetical protein